MKKWLCMLLALSSALTIASCGDKGNSNTNTTPPTTSSVTQEVQRETVTFTDVTIDISAPENVVKEANPTEYSEVFDATGKKLTSAQWLLNSKFAKEYVKTLAIGTHTFTYQSATKEGTIKLIITDSAAPRYAFNFDVSGKMNYDASGSETTYSLPLLVKDQDSYQDDYAVSYKLLSIGNETETEVAVTAAEDCYKAELAGGKYKWVATATLGERTKSFSVEFEKETFDAYIKRNEDKFLLDSSKGTFVDCSYGSYSISTTVTEYYRFQIANTFIQNAIKEGKKIHIELTTEQELPVLLWIGNNAWHQAEIKWVNTINGKVKQESGLYVYDVTLDLEAKYFPDGVPFEFMTSQKNAEDRNTWSAISSATLVITFE